MFYLKQWLGITYQYGTHVKRRYQSICNKRAQVAAAVVRGGKRLDFQNTESTEPFIFLRISFFLVGQNNASLRKDTNFPFYESQMPIR